jgi:RNA polymerase sigma factor (sigma-70 family)
MNVLRPGYYASHPNKHNEFQLLLLTKDQNPEASRAAAHSLIIGNQGFLKNTLLKWSNKGYKFNFDELYGEAMIAFYQAILHYDISQDVSIRSYARFYLLKLQRRFFRKSREIEFQPEHYRATTETTLELRGEELSLSEVLTEAITVCLTEVEKDVIVLYFIKKLNKRTIAQLRGCSERRVGIIISNALPKLRYHLQKRGVSPSLFVTN